MAVCFARPSNPACPSNRRERTLVLGALDSLILSARVFRRGRRRYANFLRRLTEYVKDDLSCSLLSSLRLQRWPDACVFPVSSESTAMGIQLDQVLWPTDLETLHLVSILPTFHSPYFSFGDSASRQNGVAGARSGQNKGPRTLPFSSPNRRS